MSELIHTNDNRATIRWKLMTTASALALTAYVSSAGVARAEDSERPPLWIELGGQMDVLQGTSSAFTAPFMFKTPTPGPYQKDSLTSTQRPPRIAFGGEGKITFQPEDSDWIFSAGIRYGRSNKKQIVHHQSAPPTFQLSFSSGTFTKYMAAFADTKTQYNEHHAILDFTAGKDVGLGAFGRDGTSNINAGVRFADFTTRSHIDMHAHPTIILNSGGFVPLGGFYAYSMQAHADRSFKGIGPSLSWNASAALVGNKHDGELTIDFGINGAVLFGRQKAKTDHTTQAYYLPAVKYAYYYYSKLYTRPHHSTRSRSVTVPNAGGFVGLSWQSEHAKISFGYRGDVFFGAVDRGIDAAKKSNLTFNGPYASISIGLGD